MSYLTGVAGPVKSLVFVRVDIACVVGLKYSVFQKRTIFIQIGDHSSANVSDYPRGQASNAHEVWTEPECIHVCVMANSVRAERFRVASVWVNLLSLL